MRRTKEDAEQTRQTILQAARTEFMTNGVANTTLDQVAKAAGVTRGAVYWHFANKNELFEALRDSVNLPLHDTMEQPAEDSATCDALDQVQARLQEVMRLVEQDISIREMCSIMTYKCEYVGELESQLIAHSECLNEKIARCTDDYERAQKQGLLAEGLIPRFLAIESVMFIGGLLRMSLLDKQKNIVPEDYRQLISHHVMARRHQSRK
ncbi:TetR family transcriptional regulator [Ampullimonas aquatilis]|uniref:TetR family transcriptional regulator n=2 Tax=Pseudomonadota TaxID=1224 RepID=UPI003C74C3E6